MIAGSTPAWADVYKRQILCWCLSFGRFLVRRTEDSSKKMLLGAFGKQPRFVWLLTDGQEIQLSTDKLHKGDIVVVHTGEVVPVDGIIVEGLAMRANRNLENRSDPQRHRRLHARLATKRRTIGRQSGHCLLYTSRCV